MRRFDNTYTFTNGRTVKDRYLLIEAGELTEFATSSGVRFGSGHSGGSAGWYGDTTESWLRKVELGDESLVAASEEMLASVEDVVPVSRGWRNVDDVVGAVPNIPAFLAGHPQHMRRRERTMRDTAPLAIFMDLTSSGGISASDIQRRGTVLLALVRRLVEHRPVELWVGAVGCDGQNGSGAVLWQIDTTPLDLARAAYRIAATAMSRGFGYESIRKQFGFNGHWPFENHDLHVKTAPERLRAVFEGRELLYVPPIYLGDEMTKDPVGWVKRVLAKYTGGTEEAAA